MICHQCRNALIQSGSGRGSFPFDLDTWDGFLTRCSAADHAILESEYQRNSKPDKAARTEIVRRVALNDKEVQVCFCSTVASVNDAALKIFEIEWL